MKPVEKASRYAGPLYAGGMTAACVAAVVLAVLGNPH